MTPSTSRLSSPRARVAALAIPVLLLAAVAVACSSSDPAPTAQSTTFKTLVTLPTTTTEGPTTTGLKTTTTAGPTTTTIPDVNGKFKMIPNFAGTTYFYSTAPVPTDAIGTTPTLTWDLKLEAGQKLSIHGPAPGVADVELTTAAAGTFAVCPGSLDVGTSTCTVKADRYTYTADIKDASGTIVATSTAYLNIS